MSHRDLASDFYRCFSLFFFYKNTTLQLLKSFCFLLAHFNIFFLIIICFSSSSIGGVPHLLRVCVIFSFNEWRRSGLFIVKFGHIYHIAMLFLLLTLNKIGWV